MDCDALIAELHSLRARVAGVTNSLVAATDGLLLAADTDDVLEPEGLAAMAAASLGLSRQTTVVVGHGTFRQAAVYSSGGYLAVYAISQDVLMAVLGDEGLDLERLHRETQPTIERIGTIMAAAQAEPQTSPH